MEETLKRNRLGILLLNLAYFAGLLVLGFLIFLRGLWGPGVFLAVAVCVALYLLVVRPAGRRYIRSLRAAILRGTVCASMTEVEYDPKGGVPREMTQESGLVPASTDRAFLSREHIRGKAGGVEVEMADTTFPIVENRLNAMFNGCFLRLTCPGGNFEPLTVRAGDLSGLKLPAAQLRCLESIGELIPGSLYLHMEGERLDILLRGRFLGFPINPLTPVTQQLLTNNPLPELDGALRLVQLRRRSP